MGVWKQHLDNLRRKGLLPRLTNDRATCLLCRLFRLGLRRFCLESPWIFPNADGGRLNLDNLRHRIWYPTLQRAGLRPRDLYQCRHTFASLMLQAGEDPAWVARMMGHTTTKMLYERYHRFIQHRTRQDGAL